MSAGWWQQRKTHRAVIPMDDPLRAARCLSALARRLMAAPVARPPSAALVTEWRWSDRRYAAVCARQAATPPEPVLAAQVRHRRACSLQRAVAAGDLLRVSLALRQAPDAVNACDPNACSLLRFALTIDTDNLEMICLLLVHGADPNKLCTHQSFHCGSTPLHVAVTARVEQLPKVLALVLCGADLQACSIANFDVLAYIAETASRETVALLLQHASNAALRHVQPARGETLWHVLAGRHFSAAALPPLVDALCDAGVDVNAQAPLDLARRCGNAESVRLLLSVPGISAFDGLCFDGQRAEERCGGFVPSAVRQCTRLVGRVALRQRVLVLVACCRRRGGGRCRLPPELYELITTGYLDPAWEQ